MMPTGFPGLPKGWVTEHDTFQSADGQLQLFGTLHYRAAEGGKAGLAGGRGLLVLHGMGEHGGRYAHFPHFLESVVDYVYCMDQRGHGRSGGLRGHVERFDSLADDVAAGVKHLDSLVRKRGQEPKVSLFAHSMGGLVGLRVLFLFPDLPLVSAIISAPALGIKAHVPFAKKAAAKVLAHVWGSLQLSTGVDASLLSHDPEVGATYLKDRLVHDKMTPLFYQGFKDAMADTLARHDGIRLPVLFVIPMKDGLIDSDKSVAYFEELEHAEKTLRTFPEFFHESCNEVGKEAFFEALAGFLR